MSCIGLAGGSGRLYKDDDDGPHSYHHYQQQQQRVETYLDSRRTAITPLSRTRRICPCPSG